MANLARPREFPCDLAKLDLPVELFLVEVEKKEGLGLACDVPSHVVVRIPGGGVAKACKRIRRETWTCQLTENGNCTRCTATMTSVD